MQELRGAVAFVTGAGHGIGRSVALALARAGAPVAVADLDAAAATAVAAEVRGLGVAASAVELDVRDADAFVAAVDAAEAELGPVRLLHNNAGVGFVERVATTTVGEWHWVVDVNFFGVVNGVAALLPRMLARGGEHHVVNTASTAGLYAQPVLGAYNAAKYAVVALTETMHEELGSTDVGVSVLCTGLVATGIGRRSVVLKERQSPGADRDRPRTPPGKWVETRVVQPDEVADLVLQGVRDGELYLFTHVEEREPVEARFAAVSAAFDRAAARTRAR